MSTKFEFDVFHTHNSEDKPLIKLIAEQLTFFHTIQRLSCLKITVFKDIFFVP